MKIGIKYRIKKTTEPLRHRIVKLLAPKIYSSGTKPKYYSELPRPMIIFLENRFKGSPLKGAEIGVSLGLNAFSILNTLRMEMLYLIDPYIEYREASIKGGDHRSVINYTEYELIAKDRLKNREIYNYQFIKKKSSEALNDIPDGLDFVYIDGNHSYENVMEDCYNYFQKIRTGGVIGGHDFYGNYSGLIRAVWEFCLETGLELLSENADWWVIKK